MPDFVTRIRDSAAAKRFSTLLQRGNTRWLLAAVAVGFVLFLLMWNHTRQQFFTVAPVSKDEATPEYAPLPIPTPGDTVTGTPTDGSSPPSGNEPRLIETPKPPPVAKAPPVESAPVSANTPTAGHGAATATAATSAAVPISQPAPAYPRAAMEMAREGRVRVRVDIGADGVPTDSSLVESSGDRDLDRAALQGVRSWRFRPAMAHGAPVASNVTVPIEFRLSGN